MLEPAIVVCYQWHHARIGGKAPVPESMSNARGASEHAWIQRFLAGDKAAVTEANSWLARAAAPHRAWVGDAYEDIKQQALVEFIGALASDRFRGDCSVRTYLRTIVHRRCVDHVRAARRHPQVSLSETDLPDVDLEPDEHTDRSERLMQLQAIVEGLPEGCRDLFRMILEGSSYKTMSEHLQIGEPALRARISRCRKKARGLRESALEGSVTTPQLQRQKE